MPLPLSDNRRITRSMTRSMTRLHMESMAAISTSDVRPIYSGFWKNMIILVCLSTVSFMWFVMIGVSLFNYYSL